MIESPEVLDRIHGSLAGLAAGDALSFPALYHRSFLLRPKTRVRLRQWTEAGDRHNVTVIQVPYTHGRNPSALELSPTDDTEWALFSARILLTYGAAPAAEQYAQAWQQEILPREESVRSGVSERAAIENFKKGLLPPVTGNDNPHHYDDGAVRRSVPIGLVHPGDATAAAAVAERDASVTAAEDGVWAAQAMAAAVAQGAAGASPDRMIDAARAWMPEGSWLAHNMRRALEVAASSATPEDAAVALHDQVVGRLYNYGNAAPETVPIAFAILSLELPSVQAAVLLANTLHKVADSLPPLVGALYGVRLGASSLPESWLKVAERCKGICLPQLAGESVRRVAGELARLALGHHGSRSEGVERASAQCDE